MSTELIISRIATLMDSGALQGKVFKATLYEITYFVFNLRDEGYSTPVCDYGINPSLPQQVTLRSFCTDFLEQLYKDVMRKVCIDDNLF